MENQILYIIGSDLTTKIYARQKDRYVDRQTDNSEKPYSIILPAHLNYPENGALQNNPDL